jgi:hypothetical protein
MLSSSSAPAEAASAPAEAAAAPAEAATISSLASASAPVEAAISYNVDNDYYCSDRDVLKTVKIQSWDDQKVYCKDEDGTSYSVDHKFIIPKKFKRNRTTPSPPSSVPIPSIVDKSSASSATVAASPQSFWRSISKNTDRSGILFVNILTL